MLLHINKNDYQSITSKLIYKDVQYQQCIESKRNNKCQLHP